MKTPEEVEIDKVTDLVWTQMTSTLVNTNVMQFGRAMWRAGVSSVTLNSQFNYVLDDAPRGKTLQLLNIGGATILGEITSPVRAKEMGIVAWAFLAERDKQEEIRRGYIQPAKAR